MNKNIVVITAIIGEVDISYKELCLNTWKFWCKKHDVELLVLDTPLTDPLYMKPTWQRWYVFSILETNNIKYNQIALVDVDTMIHWDAPNFFNETDNKFSVCVDNDNIGWVVQSLEGYSKYFTVEIDWTEYFNCGFIVINKNHKELCNSIISFWENNVDSLQYDQKYLRKGTDQTPVNYIVKESKIDVNYLNKKWNLTHLNRKELIEGLMFINNAYIWHFNGFDKAMRYKLMQSTWEHIKSNYINLN